MNGILFREKLLPEQVSLLLTEFPQYELIFEPGPLKTINSQKLASIEVVYGNNLSSKEIDYLPQLHWVHTPLPYLDYIDYKKLKEMENVLISTTREENITQMGELALAGALSFSKNILEWIQATDTKPREKMWSSQEKTVLQVGLGVVGSEIAFRMHRHGFRVWGVQESASFHDACDKTFALHELHSIIPAADIISLAFPRDRQHDLKFGKKEIALIKDDVILIAMGSGKGIDIESLLQPETVDKMRGMLLDAHFDSLPDVERHPHILYTRESGGFPTSHDNQGFSTFIYNLRQFLHDNFTDMQHLC